MPRPRLRHAILPAMVVLVTLSSLLAQGPVPRTGVGADEWARQARELLEAGAVFRALEAFDHAIAVEPRRVDLRREYAQALKGAGFWLRGVEQYRTILSIKPDDLDSLLGYGELLNSEYQFSSAKGQFSKALQGGAHGHDRERAILGLASAHFGLEDYESAARVFEALLKESPGVMSAHAFLAITLRKLGRLDEAAGIWNRFIEAQPGSSRARFHRDEINELRAEIEKTRAAVSAIPDNVSAWLALGRVLRRQPDLPGAAEAFGAAARLEPDNAEARLGHGVVLRDLGRWVEAGREFRSLSKNPRYATLALYNLAYCAKRGGIRDAESRAWADAVKANPLDMYAYRRLVKALAETEGLALERARISQEVASVKLESTSPSAVQSLVRQSIVMGQSGDLEIARGAALEALRLDINDVQARRALRDLLLLNRETARQVLAELDRASGEGLTAGAAGVEAADLDTARLRGAVLLVLSRELEALEEFKKVVQAGRRDAPTLVALAFCYKAAGRIDEAIGIVLEAREMDPGYSYAHLDLALLMLENGWFQEAAEAARQAVRLQPGNPLGYSVLGSALRGLGDFDGATRALDEAVLKDPMDDLGAPRLMLAKIYGSQGKINLARETLEGKIPQEPEQMYREAWEFVRDNYHDRSYNAQDWRKWEHRFDGHLETPQDALAAVALMLSSLDDRNTRLRSAGQTSNLLFSRRSSVAEYSPSGTALSTSRTVETRKLEDNVGYIAITNLDDPKLPQEIEEAVETLKDADGVILDLRGNQGGADNDVPEIAGMFVEPGTETGKIVGPDGTRHVQARPAGPDSKPIFDESKPVVVIVDRHTASSAENLAGSLKESGRAILVGEQTYGKSGIQVPRLLPGGAVVLVVGSEHADLKGRVYTGRGIQPDVEIDDAIHGPPSEEDRAMMKARELMKRRKSDGS